MNFLCYQYSELAGGMKYARKNSNNCFAANALFGLTAGINLPIIKKKKNYITTHKNVIIKKMFIDHRADIIMHFVQ